MNNYLFDFPEIVHMSEELKDLYDRGIKHIKSKKYHEALKIFLEAEKYNIREISCVIGYMYENGLGTEEGICYYTAIEYYLKADQYKSIYAKYRLGRMYIEGKGVEFDDLNGRRLVTEAAEAGEENAINYLNYKNYKLDTSSIWRDFVRNSRTNRIHEKILEYAVEALKPDRANENNKFVQGLLNFNQDNNSKFR
ncbi:MAG: hypothetical protein ACK4OM_03940 [Alphaproteobacteria bacterium]